MSYVVASTCLTRSCTVWSLPLYPVMTWAMSFLPYSLCSSHIDLISVPYSCHAPPSMRALYLLFPLPRTFLLFLHLNSNLSFLREAFHRLSKLHKLSFIALAIVVIFIYIGDCLFFPVTSINAGNAFIFARHYTDSADHSAWNSSICCKN